MTTCTAHSSRTGQPCRKAPVKGATVCATHGGRAPQVVAAAARRAEEERIDGEARKLLDQADADPLVDTVAALQRLAGRVQAAVDTIGGRVNDLQQLRFTDAKESEQLRSEVAIWERLLGRLHTLLVDMTRLGIEDRHVRAAERVAAAFIAIHREACEAAGLSVDQRRVIETVVVERVTALGGPE